MRCYLCLCIPYLFIILGGKCLLMSNNYDLCACCYDLQASGSAMKNIMKTCFDLRRAEQIEIKKKPVN